MLSKLKQGCNIQSNAFAKKVHFLYPHLRTYPTVNYDLVSKSVQIVPVVPFSFFLKLDEKEEKKADNKASHLNLKEKKKPA